MIISKIFASNLSKIRHFRPLQFKFSTQTLDTQFNPQKQKTSKCVQFYQNSIRKANTKPSTQRGIFTQHHLTTMIRLSEPSDLDVMFQAYYNFLGHFTVYSNKTVDLFVQRVIELAQQNPSAGQATAQKLFELFKNHDYLRYYPKYDTTLKVAKLMAQNGKYLQFLRMINQKLLIKIDRNLYEQFMNMVNDWAQFSIITKMGTHRCHWGIIENLEKKQILKIIAKGADKFDSCQSLKRSELYIKFLKTFEQKQPNVQLAICWLIMQEGMSNSINIIKKVPIDDPLLQVFVSIVRKLDQQSQEQYVQKIQKQLQNTEYAKLFQQA